MQKKLAILLVVSAFSGAASAQFLPKDGPFRAEVGLYVPTFDDGGKSVGAGAGLGFSFYRKNNLDLAAVVRYNYFTGDISGLDYKSNLLTYGIDARYRIGSKAFVGVGLGAAQINLDFDGPSGDTTKLGYSVEAGYDITKSLYGVVRFQATTDNIKPYQGVTVGVGYRF